jgi:hypothetical protein
MNYNTLSDNQEQDQEPEMQQNRKLAIDFDNVLTSVGGWGTFQVSYLIKLFFFVTNAKVQ